MGWIKDIITDIIVTSTIIIAVFWEHEVLTGVVLGYSVLMLVAKIIVYFGDQHLRMLKKVKSDAPKWISHLLYGLNVAFLVYFKWWYTGGTWVLIWVVSWASQRKLDKK